VIDLNAIKGFPLFAEDRPRCLSITATCKLRGRGRNYRIAGIPEVDNADGSKHSDIRKLVEVTYRDIDYKRHHWLADKVTGSLYNPQTGKCLSSNLQIVGEV